MSQSFDSRIRKLIGETDSGLTDRLGDILMELHARSMVVAAEFEPGRQRDAWVRFAKRIREVFVNVHTACIACTREPIRLLAGALIECGIA